MLLQRNGLRPGGEAGCLWLLTPDDPRTAAVRGISATTGARHGRRAATTAPSELLPRRPPKTRKPPRLQGLPVMRWRGLEPPRPCGHKALNLARLPIPPPARGQTNPSRSRPERSPLSSVRSSAYYADTNRRSLRPRPRDASLQLTKRQQEILRVVQDHIARHGYPPTVREIGDAVGLTSSSTVHAHLQALESRGALKRDPTKPRALDLRDRPVDAHSNGDGVRMLPLLGAIAAGTPILAEQNVEEEMAVPGILTTSGECFLLRIRGESMTAGRHPRRRLRRRPPPGRLRRGRHRRGAGRRHRGDRQAARPCRRPRAPHPRERRHGAVLPRAGRRPGQDRRRVPPHVEEVLSVLATAPTRTLDERSRDPDAAPPAASRRASSAAKTATIVHRSAGPLLHECRSCGSVLEAEPQFETGPFPLD